MGSIGPYTIIQELSNKDAGSSEWGFVQKDGREYYIKKFPSPKYPLSYEDIGKELFEKKRQKADAFFKEKNAFYTALKKCESGNNIIVRDFFREGSSYYAVTDKITGAPITIQEIAKLNDDKKTVLISAIFYSIMLLHENGLVHADIKPDNLIIKKTRKGYFTAKIVDFDAGFFVDRPPKNLVGDFVYLAPESYLRNEGVNVTISEKIDVFALGLLLHQYWTGHLPEMGEDAYAFLHVLNDGILKADEHIPSRLRRTIEEMLDRNPEKRPSAKAALARITNKPMML